VSRSLVNLPQNYTIEVIFSRKTCFFGRHHERYKGCPEPVEGIWINNKKNHPNRHPGIAIQPFSDLLNHPENV